MVSARFRIGTSGWQYDHWRDTFYPKDLPKARWFEYYAGVFDTVEVNNSFYRQPKEGTWASWRDEAPAGFRYAVKANRYITHMKRFKDPEDPIKRFLHGAELLGSKLGPLLFQAPPDFEKDERNFERLEAFLACLPRRHTNVLEFRDDSWFKDETFEMLRRHGVALCVHDAPGLHCPVTATASAVYVRMHGGEKGYAGNYDEAALQGWAERLKGLPSGVEEVWVYFNNDLEGHAPHNALRLREILGA